MTLICIFMLVPLVLFFGAKGYFKLIEKLHFQRTKTSKITTFLLWIAVSILALLSVFIPIVTIKRLSPELDVKWGVIPLLLSMLLIVIFQKKEIKRLSNILNGRE